MLKFPRRFLEDEKANDIVKKYWNNRLLDMLEEVTGVSVSNGDFEKIDGDDKRIGEVLHPYFPDRYTLGQRIQYAMELYFLLKSDEEYVPKIEAEYLMASMIEARLRFCRDMKLPTREPIMENRPYLLEVLDREYGKGIDTGEDWWPSADEKLAELEDLQGYPDIFFWDMDYIMLDQFTEQQLIDSGADKMLGMGIAGRNTFVIKNGL